MSKRKVYATLIAIVLFAASIYLSGIALAWTSAAVVVLVGRGGLSAVSSIPTKYLVFPVSAPWFTETEKNLWNICGVLSILAIGIVLVWVVKLWRVLVVCELKLMTNEEVDEVLRRGGDGPGYG